MKEERISEFSMVLLQGTVFAFISFFLVFITKMLWNANLDMTASLFLFVILILVTVTVRVVLILKDVFLDKNKIVSKNIFFKRIDLLSDVESVEELLFPYYRIRLKSGIKIYFRIRSKYITISLTKTKTENILHILQEKLGLNIDQSLKEQN